MSQDLSRRRLLGAVSTGIAGIVAGCAAPVGSQARRSDVSTPSAPGEGGETTAYTRVYREVIDSVVQIRAFVGGDVSQGSGFAYFREGLLLTNEHVVSGADAIEVRFSRGEWRTGRIVGADVYSDLAVVRVERPPTYAVPLDPISDRPAVGERVVAIGSPFGLENSLSAGVVSGVNRSIPTDAGFSIPGAVQTDAAVNPGNSGGPLVTLDGRLVGIIRSGGGDNIGFAVSAPLVERIVPELVRDGEYDHPFLGVFLTTVTPSVARANGLSEPRGVIVVDVLEGGPSDGVLRGSDGEEEVNGVSVPTGGDVIVALSGRSIESLSDLSRFLAFRTRPGRTISATVIRGGERTTLDLTVGERPPPGSDL